MVFAANEERAKIMWDEYGAPVLPTVIHNYPPFMMVDGRGALMQYVREQGRDWEYIVLHQGSVRADRAPEEAIEALKFVTPGAGIVFLGSVTREYEERLLQIAESRGVADRVLFHPPVSLDVLPSFTASATLGLVLYLNTCRNNYYCAPTKLYEYLMCGIPVVGSAFPGLRRVIEGNKVGAVADPQDSEALAHAINRLLQETEFRRAMGITARQLAKEEWNWEQECCKVRKAYRRLIRSSGRALGEKQE
jgi:glycosyltransferase involved in cell wall biosynthesis